MGLISVLIILSLHAPALFIPCLAVVIDNNINIKKDFLHAGVIIKC